MPTHANMLKSICPFLREEGWCLPPEEFVTIDHPDFCPCAVADYDNTRFDSADIPYAEQKWHCGLMRR